MRISFYGYDETADVVLTPPSEIRYRIPSNAATVTTTKRRYRLRRLSQQTGLEIALSWTDIPEDELAILARIPADEIHEVILESASYPVILGEPQRSMRLLSDWRGTPVYQAALTLYVANEHALGEVISSTPPTQRVLAISRSLNQAARNYPPQEPTPAYTPIVPAAARGLPPGVGHLEGFRWTFLNADAGTYLRYFDESSEGWYQTLGTPEYADWYSVRNGNRLAQADLHRVWFVPDDAWSLGMLLHWDAALADGPLLEVWNDHYLYLFSVGRYLNVQYVHSSGVAYTDQLDLSGGYHYLGLSNGYGNVELWWDGTLRSLSPQPTNPIRSVPKHRLGGGSVRVDDLLLVNGVQVYLEQVRRWLLGL